MSAFHQKPIAKIALCFFCLGLIFFSQAASNVIAVEAGKQYQYDKILTNIHINSDSTFDVEEKQTFDYEGEYHQGWRTIPFNKFDAITDIQVVDGETGIPLAYSPDELNKTDPNSWGKFTYNRKNGVENIIWYYNATNVKHLWILKYKIHGGVGFFKGYDELYWNVVTDYSVPVRSVETHVFLPQELSNTEGMYINYYSDPTAVGNYSIPSGNSYDYYSQNIPPRGKITILAQWPKGLVDKSAYYKDFVMIYWGYLISFILILVGLIAGFIYWYFTEKYNKGTGTIVAQYAPPKNLRPAEAEILCKERVTNKTWPATIVDLAIRGYVTIKETELGSLKKAGNILAVFLVPVLLAIVAFTIFSEMKNFSVFNLIFSIFLIVYFFFAIFRLGKNVIGQKAYEIVKAKEFAKDTSLDIYENQFLSAIFKEGDSFKTDSRDRERKQKIYEDMQKVEKELLKDVESETQAYEVSLVGEERRNIILTVISFVSFFAIIFFSKNGGDTQAGVFAFTLILLIMESIYFMFEARLNKAGNILKEDWLGFKIYLETAEKYRMQNLTPELFEKFLPYAIIFGVEKEWAKNFESLNMESPQWFSGSAGAGTASFSNSGASSFSATSFASSFGASFASSFSSSGAGGAGGGGGGAGGGGGGGGGGAS